MNSKELAQAIETEQDRINELEAEILEIEHRLHRLREEQRVSKAKAEATEFFSEHFKIITVGF